jgi:hypothetical protein
LLSGPLRYIFERREGHPEANEDIMSNGTYTIIIKQSAADRFVAILDHSNRNRYEAPAMIGPYKTEKIARSMAVKFAAKVGIPAA